MILIPLLISCAMMIGPVGGGLSDLKLLVRAGDYEVNGQILSIDYSPDAMMLSYGVTRIELAGSFNVTSGPGSISASIVDRHPLGDVFTALHFSHEATGLMIEIESRMINTRGHRTFLKVKGYAARYSPRI